MFNKRFGKRDPSNPDPQPSKAHLERLLTDLRSEILPVDWIVLVAGVADTIASSPIHPAVEADRVNAMASAMSSVGSRIAEELKLGGMRYVIVAGMDDIIVVVQLSSRYMLGFGVKRSASITECLSLVQEKSGPLLQALHLPLLTRLPGTGQM